MNPTIAFTSANYNRLRLASLKLMTLYCFIVKKELHCRYFVKLLGTVQVLYIQDIVSSPSMVMVGTLLSFCNI